MLENVKRKISLHLITKKFLQKPYPVIKFGNFVKDSRDFLILMPADEKEFYLCNDFIKYLIIHKKHVTLFVPEHKLNLLQDRHKYYQITYSFEQVTKFELPNDSLINKMNSREFDVVVDLNREESLLHSSITNVVSAKYRIGFSKDNADKFYNFQVINHQDNPEISYRNLLNYFQMF